MIAPAIVVLDTSDEFLLMMGDFLSEEGYHLALCDDRAHFPALVRRTLPVLVILDLWLAAPDAGWVALDALRCDPVTCAIPVIICTSGSVPVGTQAALLRQWDYPVLQKPFDLDVMLTLIQTVLHAPAGASDAPVPVLSDGPRDTGDAGERAPTDLDAARLRLRGVPGDAAPQPVTEDHPAPPPDTA